MIAEEMRMHHNYDVVIAGGRAFNPFYCASFGIDENILYNVGLPRMDDLRENVERSRELFYATYPQYRGKKIVLYAPTFRGNALDCHCADVCRQHNHHGGQRDDGRHGGVTRKRLQR